MESRCAVSPARVAKTTAPAAIAATKARVAPSKPCAVRATPTNPSTHARAGVENRVGGDVAKARLRGRPVDDLPRRHADVDQRGKGKVAGEELAAEPRREQGRDLGFGDRFGRRHAGNAEHGLGCRLAELGRRVGGKLNGDHRIFARLPARRGVVESHDAGEGEGREKRFQRDRPGDEAVAPAAAERQRLIEARHGRP